MDVVLKIFFFMLINIVFMCFDGVVQNCFQNSKLPHMICYLLHDMIEINIGLYW